MKNFDGKLYTLSSFRQEFKASATVAHLKMKSFGNKLTMFQNYVGRSSHQRRSMKKGVLKNLTGKVTGKLLCQSLFFYKAEGLRPATLLRKRVWHRCFPVNFVKFLRTPFLQNTSGYCFFVDYLKLNFMHQWNKTWFKLFWCMISNEWLSVSFF